MSDETTAPEDLTPAAAKRELERVWRGRSPATTGSTTWTPVPNCSMPTMTHCAGATRPSRRASPISSAPTVRASAWARRRPRRASPRCATPGPCCRSPTRSTTTTSPSSWAACGASSISPRTSRWRSTASPRSTASRRRCTIGTASWCWAPPGATARPARTRPKICAPCATCRRRWPARACRSGWRCAARSISGSPTSRR